MARLVANAVLDAALNYVANNGTNLHICEGQPDAIASGTLSGAGFVAELAEYTGLTSADYTLADGTTDGRMATVAAQTGAVISTTGSANHLAVSDGVNNLIYVTEIQTQTLTSGGNVDTGAWDIVLRDPTAPV